MKKSKVKSKTKVLHNVKGERKSRADRGAIVKEPQQQSTAGTSIRVQRSNRRKAKTPIVTTPVSMTPTGTTPTGNSEDGPTKLMPAPSKETMSRKAFSREPPSTRTSKVPAAKVENVWLGASAAKAWMEKADFTKAKSEFEKISSMVVDVEKECKKWKANAKLNQSDEYPVLDSKLVKTEEYVNMSHVDVPLHRNILMGQIPLPGSEEAFWKAVFDQRAMCIHLMIGDDEKIEFFPQRTGDFMHYGSMFVNNRKVENISDDIARFAVEVLPAGCSNSIITSFTVIKNWNMDTVHAKYACVIKQTIEMNNFLSNAQPDETALVMSKHGAGRAGYFVALTIAVAKMDQKVEPDLLDIVKSMRAQRPRTVDTLPQYASLYISMFYFIKRKMSKAVEGDKKATPDTNDPLCKKAMQLTTQFVNGLVEEANAAGARSTMTSIP